MFLRILPRWMPLAVCLLWLGLAVAQTGDQIDWSRAQQIHQKFLRGDKLTDEEQAYHDRAAKALRAKSKQGNQSPPAKPPTGLKPLCDMTAEDRYKQQDGGLYGGGKNEPPQKHLQAAMRQARLIRPLDGDGKPSKNGKIVLISVGMSNTTQEFSAFVRLANADAEKSPKVVIVDGAQGGQTANVWANPGARNPWDVLDQRLRQAGVTAAAGAGGLGEAGPCRSGESWRVSQARRGAQRAHGRASKAVEAEISPMSASRTSPAASTPGMRPRT